jgi:hypothetical protein
MEIEESYTKRERKETKAQGQVGPELYALPESCFFRPFISQRRPEAIQLMLIRLFQQTPIGCVYP